MNTIIVIMAAVFAGATAFASFGTMSTLVMTAFRRKGGMPKSILVTIFHFISVIGQSSVAVVSLVLLRSKIFDSAARKI